MALVPCKECGKEISDKAKACPQCGVPLKLEVGCGAILLFFLFGMILLYSSCKEMITSQYNIFWEERFIKQKILTPTNEAKNRSIATQFLSYIRLDQIIQRITNYSNGKSCP